MTKKNPKDMLWKLEMVLTAQAAKAKAEATAHALAPITNHQAKMELHFHLDLIAQALAKIRATIT